MMNYKKMALILFLVPMMSCASNVQETKKHLEKKQSELEKEIDDLGNYLQDESMKYIAFSMFSEYAWNQDEKTSSFDEFIEKIQQMLKDGKDVTSLIEQCKFLGNIDINSKVILLRIALKNQYLEKKILKYDSLVNELLLITQKINNLK